MKTDELIRTVANVSGIAQGVVKDVLETAADVISETLGTTKEESVTVPGFGKFHARSRLPRLGRNPKTGAECSIPGRRVAKFVPGKRFRDWVAGNP